MPLTPLKVGDMIAIETLHLLEGISEQDVAAALANGLQVVRLGRFNWAEGSSVNKHFKLYTEVHYD